MHVPTVFLYAFSSIIPACQEELSCLSCWLSLQNESECLAQLRLLLVSPVFSSSKLLLLVHTLGRDTRTCLRAQTRLCMRAYTSYRCIPVRLLSASLAPFGFFKRRREYPILPTCVFSEIPGHLHFGAGSHPPCGGDFSCGCLCSSVPTWDSWVLSSTYALVGRLTPFESIHLYPCIGDACIVRAKRREQVCLREETERRELRVCVCLRYLDFFACTSVCMGM